MFSMGALYRPSFMGSAARTLTTSGTINYRPVSICGETDRRDDGPDSPARRTAGDQVVSEGVQDPTRDTRHMRDARPFVAHHLRQRANERRESNGDALHELARWVENLPARDPRMARIEATAALGYD